MKSPGRKAPHGASSSSSSFSKNDKEERRRLLLETTASSTAAIASGQDQKVDFMEQSKRSRADFFFRHCHNSLGTRSQRQIVISIVVLGAILMMLIVGLSGMDLTRGKRSFLLPQPPPGGSSSFGAGLSSTTTHLTPIPSAYAAARRRACIAQGQTTVMRAFQQRGWSVVAYSDTYEVGGREPMKACTSMVDSSSLSVILWTKHKPYGSFFRASQPWQRHNWLPNQNIISSKGSLIRALKDYAAQKDNNYSTGRRRSIDFLPDSYVLPVHYEELLNRMLHGTDQTTMSDESSYTKMTITGLDEPWVLKLAATDNGIGIAMLGPHSDRLQALIRLLHQSSNSTNNSSSFIHNVMPQIREEFVFSPQVNDNRDIKSIQRARQRSAQLDDDIIIQRYVCQELDYQGHKFDLRVFWLVASVQPLVVLYHDGTLRVALSAYNDTDFTSTSSHLTNIGRNRAIDNCTASIADWQVTLQAHVAAHPGSFSAIVRDDPLLHIRRQIMDALATIVASTRDVAFGLNGSTDTENGFALMGGDFIVDRDLNVWITEAQSSPGLGHETPTRTALYNRLLPSVVDIIDEVLDKQMNGKPLLPLKNTGDFELIYTDDFQYRYDFPRRLKRGPC